MASFLSKPVVRAEGSPGEQKKSHFMKARTLNTACLVGSALSLALAIVAYLFGVKQTSTDAHLEGCLLARQRLINSLVRIDREGDLPQDLSPDVPVFLHGVPTVWAPGTQPVTGDPEFGVEFTKPGPLGFKRSVFRFDEKREIWIYIGPKHTYFPKGEKPGTQPLYIHGIKIPPDLTRKFSLGAWSSHGIRLSEAPATAFPEYTRTLFEQEHRTDKRGVQLTQHPGRLTEGDWRVFYHRRTGTPETLSALGSLKDGVLVPLHPRYPYQPEGKEKEILQHGPPSGGALDPIVVLERATPLPPGKPAELDTVKFYGQTWTPIACIVLSLMLLTMGLRGRRQSKSGPSL